MLKPISWAQLYYGSSGKTGAVHKLTSFALYNAVSGKLIKVFRERKDALLFLSEKKYKKFLFVRWEWENNEQTKNCGYLGFTPMKIQKNKLKLSSSTNLQCNYLEGKIQKN